MDPTVVTIILFSLYRLFDITIGISDLACLLLASVRIYHNFSEAPSCYFLNFSINCKDDMGKLISECFPH